MENFISWAVQKRHFLSYFDSISSPNAKGSTTAFPKESLISVNLRVRTYFYTF